MNALTPFPKRLGTCLQEVRSWNPAREASDEDFSYIDLGAIDNQRKLITGVQRISGKAAPSRARQLVKAGDVLVSTVRPYLNGVARVPEDLDGATASTGFSVLRADPARADGSYLYHWVRSPGFVTDMIRKSTGASYPAVSDRIVRDSLAPLPPLPEQKRIAAILDEADEVRRKRVDAIVRLAKIRQALFYDMFGDPQSNPKGWKVGCIGDLLREVRYGTAAKANTEGLGLPILRMGNITYDGRIDLADLKHVEISDKDVPKYTAQRDDILFNRTNSKELVGKTAVVRFREPMVIAGYLIRARVNDLATPDYISAYLNSKHGKAVLSAMCKNIVGMANINAQEMQRIAIAIPPVDHQKKYSVALQTLETKMAPMQEALRHSEALFASLQHCAFRGEL